MSEEEKKAIEILDSLRVYNLNKFISDKEARAIMTILKLIEKQQEKIEHLKFYIKEIEIYKQNLFEAYEKQQKEIEELKEKEKNLLGQLKDSEKELLEVTQNVVSKDKIKEEIKKLNEKNGIAINMYTGKIVKTEADYQIAILKKY